MMTVITMKEILTAIAIGVAIGSLIVIAIALARKNQKVNSLVDTQEYINAIVTVRVPFNQETRGSVWIEQAGHRVVMTAQTREKSEFLRGEQAVVVDVYDGKVWVSHTDSIWPS
ncbi:MAG: hypothetical protein H7237_09845 [Alkalinema sp. FL-bin-369]|jgi:hypothetical protein|nr:hypothetical protein [Leptolyngbyaceae cyanobacterium LF-bin-369]